MMSIKRNIRAALWKRKTMGSPVGHSAIIQLKVIPGGSHQNDGKGA